MPHELFHKLSVGQTAEGEIEQILLSHFKSSRQADVDSFLYPNAEVDYALRGVI